VTEHKPIKRHPALQPVSREHHDGLMCCFKIRQGLERNIELKRISAYVHWFCKEHLEPHFQLEEQHIFPLLPARDELNLRAAEEHAMLRSYFDRDEFTSDELMAFEQLLEQHIRFEERIMFNVIQEANTSEQLIEAMKLHRESDHCDVWPDVFWV
jgi:iron-sulfur cluster repair protein YtfE (RIC family)